LGNVTTSGLSTLAHRWCAERLPAFLDLASAVVDRLANEPGPPVINWYAEMARAARTYPLA
jgi:hypothetical protein